MDLAITMCFKTTARTLHYIAQQVFLIVDKVGVRLSGQASLAIV